MTETEPITLEEGRIQLYDYYRATLPGGRYRISATQEVDFAEIVDRKRGAEGDGTVKRFSTDRTFHVLAPHFLLGPGDVHAVYPPGNSVGDFANTLPHVVLRRRSLPWERELGPDDQPPIPWLALLLFHTGDDDGHGPPARILRPLEEIFRPVEDGVTGLAAQRIDPDPLDDLENKAHTIDVPGRIFAQIAPRLAELPLLAHVRQVNTGDKELLGLQADGWFSVVVGNRLPKPGQLNTAHLVSLYGWQEQLPDQTAPLSQDNRLRGVVSAMNDDSWTVSNVSLAVKEAEHLEAAIRSGNAVTVTADILANGAWRAKRIERFSGSDRSFDFVGAVAAQDQETWSVSDALITLNVDTTIGPGIARRDIVRVRGQVQAGNTWLANDISLVEKERMLRLVSLASWSFTAVDSDRGNFKELMEGVAIKSGPLRVALDKEQRSAIRTAANRPSAAGLLIDAVGDGYVPLNYETRHGEKTAGWYRGPLLPLRVKRVDKDPYESAEAALIYDPLTGLFDASYAVAWQIGRLLALADGGFAAALQRWRQEGHRLMDQILDRQGLGDRFAGAHLFTSLDRIEAANALLAQTPPEDEDFQKRYDDLQALLQTFMDEVQDPNLMSERLFSEVMAGLIDRLILNEDPAAALASAPIDKPNLAAGLSPLPDEELAGINQLAVAERAGRISEKLLAGNGQVEVGE